MILKDGGIATTLVVSHQLFNLGNKTGYQVKAWTLALYPLIKQTDYLICIFMNINENLTRKTHKNMINNMLQPKTIITPPLLYGFTSSLIHISDTT